MRVLFSTQPGFGHLNPVLPYAVALRDAGHEVRFASAPSFVEAVEAHGFRCEGVGEDFTWERAHEFFPASVEAAKAGRGLEYAIFEIGWKRWMPRAARDLVGLIEHWRPGVIVREFAENGATLAGELTGVPVVCAAWTALPADALTWGRLWDWERWVACYAAEARALGLVDEDAIASWERQLVLSALPPSWFGRTGGRATIHHFRLTLAEGPISTPPQWLDGMGRDRRLIYATLGTVFNKMRRVRTAMLEALGDVDAEVLMTVGRDVDPEGIGPVPVNVRIERFVPQSLVLGRASLVVSHAGLGTMLGAIYQGIPMVVIAVGGDQPANAQLAAELGIAVALERETAQPAALQAAITAALDDAAMRRTAGAVRSECAAMAPASDVVGVLELAAAQTG